MRDQIHVIIGKMESTLAKDLESTYRQEIEEFNENLRHILKAGFSKTEDEIVEYLRKSEIVAF